MNNVNVDKYLAAFHTGKTIFHEGDSSKDLYILVSGEVDIFKGKKKIAEINEEGSFFGEMSFLLETQRTATARAKKEVNAIRIPKEEVTTFLHEFPSIASEMTTLLAKRLDETSQTLYRLKEFCDQLPDSVIATDREGKIITWNAAAEKLYGRAWNQMKNRSVAEIYEEPRAYQQFLEEVKTKNVVREKILKVRHPQIGARFISTSTTLLYDENKNFHGILSLGRDVTAVQKLERKYKRIYYWLFLSMVISVFLMIAFFGGYSNVAKDRDPHDLMNQELKDLLENDYILLRSRLIHDLLSSDRKNSDRVIKDFLSRRKEIDNPYFGLVLLDRNKMVFAAYSSKDGIIQPNRDASSYKGVAFQRDGDSIPNVFTLYRADKDHPMGKKSVEIAFSLMSERNPIGWLIFQLEPDHLINRYGIDESALKKIQF